MHIQTALYISDDGQVQLDLKQSHDTLWLTQAQISELFSTSTDNISLHLKNIYAEAELVEAKQCSGAAKRLRRDDTRGFAALLEGLVGLGEVMCLTRNEHAVHERYGEFDNVNIGKVMGLVLNRTIDLRVFMNRWAFGFVI